MLRRQKHSHNMMTSACQHTSGSQRHAAGLPASNLQRLDKSFLMYILANRNSDKWKKATADMNVTKGFILSLSHSRTCLVRDAIPHLSRNSQASYDGSGALQKWEIKWVKQ